MDQNTFKNMLHDAVRSGTLQAATEYYKRIAQPDAETEDLRKAIVMGAAVTGAEAPKATDPLAGLMTVNITFVNGGVQAEVTQLPMVEEVEDIQPKRLLPPTVEEMDDKLAEIQAEYERLQELPG